jgi:hypothetical protein
MVSFSRNAEGVRDIVPAHAFGVAAKRVSCHGALSYARKIP